LQNISKLTRTPNI